MMFFLSFVANEKNKSMNQVNLFLNTLLTKNLNRSDLLISFGVVLLEM